MLGILVGLVQIDEFCSLQKEISSSSNLKEIHAVRDERLNLECKVVVLGIVLYLLMMLMCAMLFLQNIFENVDIFYVAFLIKKLPNQSASKIFYWLYFGTFPILTYGMFCNSFAFIYVLIKIKRRLDLLCDVSEDLCTHVNHLDDFALSRDTRYQKEIFEKLKCCISEHIFLKR